ncbi:MAG: DNA polymerase III subunit gamma/tau, partial [Mariprofundaceae bacterium]
PCGSCSACQGISTGANLDVQEMDAASHTGVDDVREILDGVRYPPNSLKTKVYIIDEAHMLSKSAFNALLKTLEEPPAQVMFILATTEAEKLPVTVRSRCQRFDLRRLGQSEISDYLAHVFGEEKVAADENAVAAIAQAADGSVRDALSLAERVLAYNSDKLSLDAVHAALGMVGGTLIRSLSGHIFEGRIEQALISLRQGVAGGHAPRSVLQELGRLWHRLACLLADESLLPDEPDAEQRSWLQAHAERLTHPMLDLRYQVLLTGLRDLSLMDERLAAEMLVMRLSGLQQLAPVSGVVLQAGHSGAGQKVGVSSAAVMEKEREALQSRDKQVESASIESTPMEQTDKQGVESGDGPTPEPELALAAEQMEHAGESLEPDLPLHEAGDTAPAYDSWQDAVDAFALLRPGVSAMLDHVVCLEFAPRVRLALDKHQQRAIASADRLAFAEWLGREVLWEARQGEG